MGEEATFYTVSNSGFFPGTAALLNSLRLVGHVEPLVVLDTGFTADQRRRLAEHAQVVDVPPAANSSPMVLKPFPALTGADGIAVVIDSDVIVTAPLVHALELAREGKVALYPDHESDRSRWFGEWEQAFALSGPPRAQTYVNSGLVAVSTSRWPELLTRWWEACQRIPTESESAADPLFLFPDQDALNGVLMSELDWKDLAVMAPDSQIWADRLHQVVVSDEDRLTCSYAGEPVWILHHCLGPKVWSDAGWRRMRKAPADAYIRLLPRVLFADDVTLRLAPEEVPWWLRPRVPARLTVSVLGAARGAKRRLRRPALS